MSIIWKYIFTNVRERKTRTAVMLLSILLATTLLFVSMSIGASYESAQQKMARGLAGSATLSVTAPDGGIAADALPELSAIGASVGLVEGKALYHENGYYEAIDLIAADLPQLYAINPPRLVNGGEITGFTGNQVILPERFTAKYGIVQGDDITLHIGGRAVALRVAEIAAYDTVFLRHTRGATALLPLDTLSELLGQTDGYSEILVKPAEGVDTAWLKEALAESLPAGEYHVSEVVNEAQIKADAREKSLPFFLISFFALTMSVYIIYGSYKIITLERLPVIGTFRSIGATQKSVARILLWESALYGAAGGLLGIPLGVAVLGVILRGMGQALSTGIEIPPIISPLSVLASFAVALLVSLLAAWLPVRRASRLPIKAVVLGIVEERQLPRRWIVGVGAVLLGLSLLLPNLASGKMLYLAGGFSLLGLITAAILLVPLLTNLLVRGLEALYGALLGSLGRLAAGNMRDDPNVAQNITLLFISISAVIAITVVGSFVTAYVGDVFRDAELQGFADGTMTPEFVEQVKDMAGIQRVLPLYVYKNKIQANGMTLSRLEATDNLAWYNDLMALHYTDQDIMEQALAAFGGERAILFSASGLARTGLSVGDTVTLTEGAEEYDYRIVGSFKSRATDVEAVIAAACAVADFGADSYGFLAYTAADPDAIMIQIRTLFGDTPNWSRTVAEFNTDALATVGAFLRPMHSLTYFILLLATVGIINNLLISCLQKRRIIAMYKSVGLSNRQSVKMTLIEGFTTGIIGAAIAMAVSYLEIRTIFLVAGPKIAMTPELDAAAFLAAGLMGVLITLTGSIAPIYKTRRMRLVEEIKFE